MIYSHGRSAGLCPYSKTLVDTDTGLLQIPANFPYVAEAALREFFRALQAGKDAEPSWKKAIYKVIARLDENVPEYFRLPSFLEQLE